MPECSTVGLASLAAMSHASHCEDSVIVDQNNGVVAVFDGIGGAARGQEASLAAAEAIEQTLPELQQLAEPEARRQWLQAGLLSAGAKVREVRTSMAQGTTAAVAVLADGLVLAASIGDSRIYHYRDTLQQLTVDDDILDDSATADAARLEVDKASTIKELRSKLARELFAGRNRLGDEVGMRRSPAEIQAYPVQEKDLIVACSDGVHDNLTQQEITAVIKTNREANPQIIAESLCRAARQRSVEAHFRAKDDDITVAVMRVL